MKEEKLLNSLQYLRLFAAIAVVLFHYREKFVSAGGPAEVAALVNWGHGGVPIFFVLAGFIMVWTTKLEANPSVFLWRRAVRIYAGYLPIALLFLTYKASTTGIDHWVPGGLNLVGSLTLTESKAKKLLIFPSWSLTFELLFYLVFFVSLFFGRKYFFLAIVIVSAGIFTLGNTDAFSYLSWPMTSPLNLLFALGLFAGWISIKVEIVGNKSLATLALFSIICFGYGFFLGNNQAPLQGILSFGLGSAALILLLVECERRAVVRNWKPLSHLGDASYAIYLLHTPIMFVFSTHKLDSWLAWNGGPYTLLAVHLATVLFSASLYFSYIERPINRFARGRQFKFLRP